MMIDGCWGSNSRSCQGLGLQENIHCKAAASRPKCLGAVVDSTIVEAQDLVAALDPRYIAESVGEKQALEFTRLQKLTPKDFGPRQAEIVSRLTFRAGPNKDKEHDDTVFDDGRKRRRDGKPRKGRLPATEWAKLTEDERESYKKARKEKK